LFHLLLGPPPSIRINKTQALAMASNIGASIRADGVCRGFLWKAVDNVKVYEYCILLGITLTTYTDPLAYFRGDYPTAIYRIVGASSMNAAHDSQHLQFRMVTFQGTHIYCTAPARSDCLVWLEALQAGLEANMNDSRPNNDTIKTWRPPLPDQSAMNKNHHNTWRGAKLDNKPPICVSCGRGTEHLEKTTPLVQYGMECRVLTCVNCGVAQGVLMELITLTMLYTCSIYEQQALKQARECIAKDPAGVVSLLRNDPTISSLRRTCPLLERKCHLLETGRMDVVEFLEETADTNPIGELKKQAFRVAGDMGSAMKLLYEVKCKRGSGDMMGYILDFFLDLCEEGELSAVAFFWPQLQSIHLGLLPATTFDELCKVELMEDFLLTISTKYSVQLAMELVWGCVADLEDAISKEAASECRRRRFSVLRFVCELESLLFDFSEGWGGGSVSLRGMLTPSSQQVLILREHMALLQEARKNGRFHLSRSSRIDKINHSKFQKPPEIAAQEALRAAKHADYFSSHLSFTRRLCDIAERLRFLEVQDRNPTLVRELVLLNSSGGMGGDPLNRSSDQLVRVVRIPTTEGHVFRSKERTPVLLLMEVVEEGHDNLLNLLTDEEKSSFNEARGRENASTRKANNYTVDPEMPPEEWLSDLNESFQVGDLGVDETKTSEENGVRNHRSLSDQEKLGADTSVRKFSSSSADFDSSGNHHSPSGALGKFKRYENQNGFPETPSKSAMEKLVNSVMIDQLLLPSLEDDESKLDDETQEGDACKTSSLESSLRHPSTSKLNRSLANRMSALGENPLGNDDIRREVLTTIMTTGMKGSHAIAAGAAMSAQKSLQELDRKRAVNLILHGDDPPPAPAVGYTPPSVGMKKDMDLERKRQLQLCLGDTANDDLDVDFPPPPSEDDEAMEALRLLLIQNRVTHGDLSQEEASRVYSMRISSLRNINSSSTEDPDVTFDRSEYIEIDAGDVDSRLKGCGALPPAVLSALTLWKGGVITNGELLELVKKDIQFIQQVELSEAKLREDSAFWGRFAFGERWAEKKARINATSPVGATNGWDLQGVIVKSNDDLRQEAFVMQLIELSHEAFVVSGLELWVSPYRILATGRKTGIIEMVRNAMSFDALKKRPGYGKGGLREHLMRMTEFSPNPGEAFQAAQHNFVRSLAAYSVMSYFFMFKDRHNGNLLMDTAGHVIHIDFGFVFGIAPGGSFSLENNTPFKLTEEMMEVMGGMQSPFFSEFVTLFCCGFLALQAHMDTFLTIVEITCEGSSFKCFEGRAKEEVLSKLRNRFCPQLSKEASVAFALDLIKQATTSYGTKQYDYYQYLSQGIAA